MNIFKLGAWLSLSSTLAAQAPQTQEIEVTGTNAANVTWDSVNGRSYFLQWSSDLVNWNYFPLIEYGDGTPQFSYGFAADGNAIFSRLHYADIPFTGNVKDADFDNDGISNWNEIREGGSKTLPFAYSTAGNNISDYDSDNDGNGLPDGWEIDHSPNVGNLAPYADEDEDGLTNLEEAELGTDPNNDDTDGDDQLDGEDAVPKDGEINWKKTPESSYAWIEIPAPASQTPLALNKNGQVIFSQGLWNMSSGKWANITSSGNLVMTNKGVPFDFNHSVVGFLDINDSGAILGYTSTDPNASWAEAYMVGMYWKAGEDLDTYSAPTYFLGATETEDSAVDAAYNITNIAEDGTVHLFTSITTANTLVTTFGYGQLSTLQNANAPSSFQASTKRLIAGNALDSNRATFLDLADSGAELMLLEEGNLSLIHKATDSNHFGYSYSFENAGNAAQASSQDLSLTPSVSENTPPEDRLWVAAYNKVFIEKREATAYERWTSPSSMQKGAIRLNQQGEAITKTELWRNGKYHSLSDIVKNSSQATEVENLKTIDLASNGIILAEAKIDGGNKVGILLPVEVVELSPKLKDEDGNEIAGSEKPLPLPKRNGMIEEDPYNNRIAHRELKLKIGEPLKGKKVTWTMTPFGVENGDDVRGDWAESQNHKDRFEASADFGANGFNRLSQESGETTIADDGFTAVRVNLPPIGLNQAIVKVKIEGIDGEIEVVKFEVPAVIVIDPGHGSGTGKIDGSNAIGGEADDSKVVEHSFALDVAQKMEAEVRKNDLYKNRNVKVFLTRNTAPNIGMGDRTKVARENGCDTYVSIHFNDSVNRKHRDPFYLVDKTGNLNSADDKALGLRLRQQVETAIAAHETAAGKNSERSQYGPAHWETNLAKGLDTLSDYASATRLGNGNVVGHTPCRAALIEIEWMSHAAADALFNTEAPANEMGKKEAVRSAVAKALSDACIEDIKEYTDE